jgi:hypothetical protein
MATKTWQWIKIVNGEPVEGLHPHDSIENAGINLNDENCEYELIDVTEIYDRSFESTIGFYERISDPLIKKIDGTWTAIPQKTQLTGTDLILKKNSIREHFLAAAQEEIAAANELINTLTDEVQIKGWEQRIKDLNNYEHNESDPSFPPLPEDCVPK